ncbi:glycosyltransferase family 1 protein [Faecalibacterium prausnitzii]
MKNPIRVLHYGMSSNLGGIESFIMNVYRNIDKSKVQFDFLTFSPNIAFSDEIKEMGGRIYKLTSRRKSFVKNHREIYEFFKNHKEYINVHVHINTCSYIKPMMAAAKTSNKRKIITHSHNEWRGNNFRIKLFHKLNQSRVVEYSDSLFACSDVAGRYMFRKDGIESNKYRIIKNGIDTKKYLFNPSIRSKVRRDLDLENKFVIGHIGRLSHQKNHSFLLDIFNKVYQSNKDAVLLLIGGGELESKIKLKIKELGLETAVLMLGVRTDIPDLLQAMDVFLFPSLYEGLGIVTIEAQASGLPCIVSNAVPNEAFITELIQPISLDESSEHWAKEILRYSEGYMRKNTSSEIKENGYDILDTAKWLESFYLNNVFS